MKFLKTIRFDPSDEHVFERAAAPDEWAVSGAFAFADMSEDDAKTGKTRQAFANGFLSVDTFGRSTFTSVAECSDDELAEIEGSLARHFVEQYGAPDVEAALPTAREEIRFVRDLCETSLINTIFTVRRRFDKGEIKEEFRTIKSPDAKPAHARIWSVVEDDE
jgi:hypothetical protein